MKRRFAPLLVLFALPACAPQDAEMEAGEPASEVATPAVDAAAEEQAINDKLAAFQQAVNAGDAATVASFYAADGRLMPPNAPAANGTQAIQEAWAGFLGMPGLSLQIQTADIEVSGDGMMAYEIGTYQMAADGEGGARTEDTGKYIVVWEKQNGDWKIVGDIFNSDMPLPQS